MPKVILSAFFLFFFITWGYGQELRKVTKLPAIVNESSGIEVSGKNKIWNLNDSGGKAELYLCDTTGNLIKTVTINNSWNRDWEDLAQDDEGNFYIGNMGNNSNANTDLTIFKIPNPDLAVGDSVVAELISFKYEDQYSFPPPEDSLNFDCESILWHNGNLYLFSKHRTTPIKTNLYRIPDAPGTYVAEKIGSFQMSDNDETDVFNFWATAADISPDGLKVALLSSNKMWVFYDFQEDNFLSGKHLRINFPSSTQKEAICFVSDSELFITDEEWPGGLGRNLFFLNIQQLTTPATEIYSEDKAFSFFPNPCKDWLNIEGHFDNHIIEIFNVQGNLLKSVNPSTSPTRVDMKNMPQGMYYIKLRNKGNGKISFSSLVEKI